MRPGQGFHFGCWRKKTVNLNIWKFVLLNLLKTELESPQELLGQIKNSSSLMFSSKGSVLGSVMRIDLYPQTQKLKRTRWILPTHRFRKVHIFPTALRWATKENNPSKDFLRTWNFRVGICWNLNLCRFLIYTLTDTLYEGDEKPSEISWKRATGLIVLRGPLNMFSEWFLQVLFLCLRFYSSWEKTTKRFSSQNQIALLSSVSYSGFKK